MAKATVTYEEVKRPIAGVTLELDAAEAQTVLDLLWYGVTGDLRTSRRRFATKIRETLAQAGLEVGPRDFSGNIYFDAQESRRP